MSVTIQQKLNRLIIEYGAAALSEDPGRVKALLMDVCAENNKREVSALIAAAEQEVPRKLYHDGGRTPAKSIITRLANRLHQNRAIDLDLAEWAVKVWRACLLGEEANIEVPTVSRKLESTVEPLKVAKTATPKVADNVNNRDSKPLVSGKPYIFVILAVLAVLLLAVNFGEVIFPEEGEASPLASIREKYRIASEQGDAEAQSNLAFMYREGLGGEQNDEKAIFWYRTAASYGDAKAQVFMGWLYHDDINAGVPEVFNENTVDWRRQAELTSIEKSDELAVSYYRKAAEQGNAAGQYLLDLIYEDSIVINNNEKALAWYRQTTEHAVACYHKAAEQGSSIAKYLLGWVYKNGIGVEKDNAEAAFWYLQAAEQNSPAAQFKLGEMYHNGWGVERNDEQAVTWYRKAADQDYVNAQYRLAQMYRHGHGVEEDNGKAEEWTRKAASQGHAKAQNILGLPSEAIF